MNTKKLLSVLLALVLCLSLTFGAMAAPEEESSVPAPVEESSRPAENEPDKADVVAAIIRLLGSADLGQIRDALNDINEAIGLPRVEDFTDMAAYADALYEKFAALGLDYDHVINAVSSSELINWVNSLLFGSGDKPTAGPVEPADDNAQPPAQNNDLTSPDTGVSVTAAGAAAVTLLLSLGVVVLFKKRGIYAE